MLPWLFSGTLEVGYLAKGDCLVGLQSALASATKRHLPYRSATLPASMTLPRIPHLRNLGVWVAIAAPPNEWFSAMDGVAPGRAGRPALGVWHAQVRPRRLVTVGVRPIGDKYHIHVNISQSGGEPPAKFAEVTAETLAQVLAHVGDLTDERTEWAVTASFAYGKDAASVLGLPIPLRMPGQRPMPTEIRGLRLARVVDGATEYQVIIDRPESDLYHVVELTRSMRLNWESLTSLMRDTNSISGNLIGETSRGS